MKIKKFLTLKNNYETVGFCTKKGCQERVQEITNYSVDELQNILKTCNKCFQKYYLNDTVRQTRNLLSAELNTRRIK